MPMPPRPFTLVCSACGWKKTVVPLSDAPAPGEWFARCPRCASEEVARRPATTLEKLLVGLWR